MFFNLFGTYVNKLQSECHKCHTIIRIGFYNTYLIVVTGTALGISLLYTVLYLPGWSNYLALGFKFG